MAAQRLGAFEFQSAKPARRYDWPAWTDGSVWQIEQGEDYDVSTENMRVNLHTKAKQIGAKVRTTVFREGDVEGLRFQFYEPPTVVPDPEDEGEPEEEEGVDPEKRWHAEMVGIHADAKAIGYNASRFIRMVNEHGGLAAAKQLINADQPSDGFTELWERQRLDIAVEARALKPGFRELFTDAELAKCRKRLADYKWDREPSWEPPT